MDEALAIELPMRISLVDGQLQLTTRLPSIDHAMQADRRLLQGASGLVLARNLWKQRRLRTQWFGNVEFGEPAWDMLLDLYAAQRSGRRVSISSLCIASGVPPTTALRWIQKMIDDGVFRREADLNDGRRFFVRLSPEATRAMDSYLDAIRIG